MMKRILGKKIERVNKKIVSLVLIIIMVLSCFGGVNIISADSGNLISDTYGTVTTVNDPGSSTDVGTHLLTVEVYVDGVMQTSEKYSYASFVGVTGAISFLNSNSVNYKSISATYEDVGGANFQTLTTPNTGVNIPQIGGVLKIYLVSRITILSDNIYCQVIDINGEPQSSQGSTYTYGLQVTVREATNGGSFNTVDNPSWKYLYDETGNIYLEAKSPYSINWAMTNVKYGAANNTWYTQFINGSTIDNLPSNSFYELNVYIGGGDYVNDLEKTATVRSIPSADIKNRYFDVNLKATFSLVVNASGETVNDRTVKDYIDPRFVLVNPTTGIPLSIPTSGETYNSDFGFYIGVDQYGTYVKWEIIDIVLKNNQEAYFDKTITLMAKNEFIGGNAVPTNLSNSGITVSPSSGDVFYPFPIPTVNVPYINNTASFEKTIFYGETLSVGEITDTIKGIVSDSRLSTTLLESLFASGSTGIDYYYTGTSILGTLPIDKFGTLTFTIDPTTDFDTLEATDTSETYSLDIIFTPIDEATRIDLLEDEYLDRIINIAVGTDIIAGSIFTATYDVNYVSGELKIIKEIDEQYGASITPKYNQSFVYRIERYDTKADADAGTNVKATFYEVISFSANQGLLSKTATITGLQEGYYKVTEEISWSWKYLTTNPVISAQFIGRNDLTIISDDETFYGVVPGEKGDIVVPPGVVALNSDRIADYTQVNTKGFIKDISIFGDVASGGAKVFTPITN